MNITFAEVAIFFLVILLIVEAIHSYRENTHLYRRKDTLSNLAVGIGYFVCNIPSKGLQFFIFQWASKMVCVDRSHSRC
jgi:hypothetical protein